MGFTLYQLDEALEAVISGGFVVDEETGEVLFDCENLDALREQRNATLEAVALFVKNLDAEAAAIRSEVAALTARQKAAERKAERLRDYLTRSMLTGAEGALERLETPRVRVTFRRSAAVGCYRRISQRALLFDCRCGIGTYRCTHRRRLSGVAVWRLGSLRRRRVCR